VLVNFFGSGATSPEQARAVQGGPISQPSLTFYPGLVRMWGSKIIDLYCGLSGDQNAHIAMAAQRKHSNIFYQYEQRRIIMSNIVETSEETFEEQVLQADLPVLVDFTAVWCGPCKMLDPVVKDLANEWNGQVQIVKLDVDTNPSIAMQYQVMGVPTLMLFKNGQPVERVTGYQPKDRLSSRFSAHF
jgi:thioredoxin 1